MYIYIYIHILCSIAHWSVRGRRFALRSEAEKTPAPKRRQATQVYKVRWARSCVHLPLNPSFLEDSFLFIELAPPTADAARAAPAPAAWPAAPDRSSS